MTAHAAFDKGAAYMGVKVHEVPVDPVTRQVNLKRVRRAMFVLFDFHSQHPLTRIPCSETVTLSWCVSSYFPALPCDVSVPVSS